MGAGPGRVLDPHGWACADPDAHVGLRVCGPVAAAVYLQIKLSPSSPFIGLQVRWGLGGYRVACSSTRSSRPWLLDLVAWPLAIHQ